MSTLGIGKAISDLLVAVQLLSGYGAPAAAPEVKFVAPERLQEMACGQPCAVFGWSPPGRVIFLDRRLDPASDVMAKSILVHELVHFLQREASASGGPANCADWLEWEREAFDVQIKWLAEQRAPQRAFSRFGRYRLPIRCDDSETTPGSRPLAATP